MLSLCSPAGREEAAIVAYVEENAKGGLSLGPFEVGTLGSRCTYPALSLSLSHIPPTPNDASAGFSSSADTAKLKYKDMFAFLVGHQCAPHCNSLNTVTSRNILLFA
jgi:hypothetical protein